MSTTTCESRRRDKEVSDEEVSAPRVASGAERHRSGAPNMPLPGTVQKLCFVVQALGRSRPLQCHPARSRTTTRPSPTVMASVGQIAHLLVLIGSVIMGSGLIGLGGVCCLAPATAAQLYGLPVQLDEAVAWVRVAGLRDAGLGVAAFALLAYQRPALRYFVPAILLIPLGDALITWSAPGGTATGAATHLAGTICVGILCACTWLDPTLSSTVHDKSKR